MCESTIVPTLWPVLKQGVMAPKSGVCAFWRFAQPFLQHYIFVSCSCYNLVVSQNLPPMSLLEIIMIGCNHTLLLHVCRTNGVIMHNSIYEL